MVHMCICMHVYVCMHALGWVGEVRGAGPIKDCGAGARRWHTVAS